MNGLSRFVILLSVLVLTSLARGQNSQQPAEPAPDANAAAAVPDASPASPPPGPEIMRPTQHGFRFTPKLIELFAGKMVNEGIGKKDGLTLDAGQKDKMKEAIVKRMLDAQRRHGKEGGESFEFLLEFLIQSDGKLDAESARKLSERSRPFLAGGREFMDGLLEDARPILDDAQYKKLSDGLGEGKQGLDKFQAKMDRWAKGEVKPGNAFEQLFREDDDPTTSPVEQKAADQTPKGEEMQRAESRADQSLREVGPDQWMLFLVRAKQIFGFTDEQFKQGEAILKGYRERAKLVMTAEWKQHVRENRIKSHARKLADKEPMEPWIYHLNHEYDEMIRPLVEMGRSIHREIAALATEEQRAKVLTELQKFGTQHGMSAEEMSGPMMHLASSRPA